MKIGLSYSRCIRDIVDGIVDIEDVLVIITRTDFDPNNDEQWASIWDGYCYGGLSKAEWSAWDYDNKEHEALFRGVTMDLYNSGRMHQPRQFGAHPSRRPEIWLETVLPESELDKNPTVKQAWDNFQVIAGLSNVTLDKEYK